MKLININYRNFLLKTTAKNISKSLLFLFAGLILTFAAAYYTKLDVELQTKREFALTCNEIKTKITTRLYSHAQLLRSGSAYFEASDMVSRKEWKIFIERSKLHKNLPGIQGVGFSAIIKKEQLEQHIQNIRKEGFSEYTVRPAGDREFYTSIIYLEPFEGRNLRAFGFDMYSEPTRRKAMEQARDYDVAALSGKVVLVQETDKDLQAGTLMYVPVYRNGLPTNTIEERRAAIIGWVYSPYRMVDLMEGILGRWDLNDNDKIHLQVYDNDSISRNSLLFDSQKNDSIAHNEITNLILTIPIEFNEKKWTLRFSQSNEYFSYLHIKVFLVFLSCMSISLLIFFLALSLFNTRFRAQQLAEKLTLELKESEVKFRTIFENAGIGQALMDINGVHIDINQRAAKVYGLSAEQIIGKSIFDFLPYDIANRYLQQNRELIEKDGKRDYEDTFPTPEGNKTFSISDCCLKDTTGNCYALLSSSKDITERKQAEELLFQAKQTAEESEMHIRSISDNLVNGMIYQVIILDESNRKFTYLSDNVEKYYGCTAKEAKENPSLIYSKTHPEDLQKLIDGELDALKNMSEFKAEIRIMRPDKSYRWAQLISKPRKHNELIHWDGIVFDISEIKQAELTIQRQNKELLKLNIDKDRFMSILAHDLKSPFSSILGFSQLLINNIHKYDIVKIEKQVSVINNVAQNTFNLLEDILLWTRSQSGNLPFEPSELDFEKCCNEIVEFLKLNTNSKSITINCIDTQNIIVYADINMLNTILRNLISNAIKFTNIGGNVSINAEQNNASITITVSDNGIGISPSILAKLFDPTQIVTTMGTDNEKGTGLGLLLCKEFVERHGGKIWVESVLGKGSVFKFTLPFKTIKLA